MPRTATALKRWIRTDRRWKRKALSRWSVETWIMRLPKSLRNCSPTLFIGPRVSTAIGTKVYVCASCRYLAVFLSAAVSAAPPDNDDYYYSYYTRRTCWRHSGVEKKITQVLAPDDLLRTQLKNSKQASRPNRC